MGFGAVTTGCVKLWVGRTSNDLRVAVTAPEDMDGVLYKNSSVEGQIVPWIRQEVQKHAETHSGSLSRWPGEVARWPGEVFFLTGGQWPGGLCMWDAPPRSSSWNGKRGSVGTRTVLVVVFLATCSL